MSRISKRVHGEKQKDDLAWTQILSDSGAKVALSRKRQPKKEEVASYCPKNEFGSAFNVPNMFPHFKPKRSHQCRYGEMVCRSTVTLISSGEGYGFIIDKAYSDSRVSYGYGETERSTALIRESSLGCLSPSPSSGNSHPSRRGRTPSRPSPLHPPTPACPNNDRSPNCYAGGIGLSIGVLKRRFTQPLAFCPLIAFSEYRKMLRDATEYGFFEERGSTRVLHCLARQYGYVPTPIPALGAG